MRSAKPPPSARSSTMEPAFTSANELLTRGSPKNVVIGAAEGAPRKEGMPRSTLRSSRKLS